MRRLICVFVVRIWQKQVFTWCGSFVFSPNACCGTGNYLDSELYWVLSRQRITKALIRLRECAGWPVPLLFAYGKNRFSHDVAHLFCFFSPNACCGTGNPPTPNLPYPRSFNRICFLYLKTTITSKGLCYNKPTPSLELSLNQLCLETLRLKSTFWSVFGFFFWYITKLLTG